MMNRKVFRYTARTLKLFILTSTSFNIHKYPIILIPATDKSLISCSNVRWVADPCVGLASIRLARFINPGSEISEGVPERGPPKALRGVRALWEPKCRTWWGVGCQDLVFYSLCDGLCVWQVNWSALGGSPGGRLGPFMKIPLLPPLSAFTLFPLTLCTLSVTHSLLPYSLQTQFSLYVTKTNYLKLDFSLFCFLDEL